MVNSRKFRNFQLRLKSTIIGLELPSKDNVLPSKDYKIQKIDFNKMEVTLVEVDGKTQHVIPMKEFNKAYKTYLEKSKNA